MGGDAVSRQDCSAVSDLLKRGQALVLTPMHYCRWTLKTKHDVIISCQEKLPLRSQYHQNFLHEHTVASSRGWLLICAYFWGEGNEQNGHLCLSRNPMKGNCWLNSTRLLVYPVQFASVSIVIPRCEVSFPLTTGCVWTFKSTPTSKISLPKPTAWVCSAPASQRNAFFFSRVQFLLAFSLANRRYST